jgi:hypothetical protein
MKGILAVVFLTLALCGMFFTGYIAGHGPISYVRSPNLSLNENSVWMCPYVAKEHTAYCMTLGELMFGMDDTDGGSDD